MPISEAQLRATAKYQAKNYDQLITRVSKGRKSEIQAHAAANGESLNGFVNRAIDEAVKRDTTKQAAQNVTQQTDRLILDMLGYDPLAEMDLYVEANTERQYLVKPVCKQSDPSEWINEELPF